MANELPLPTPAAYKVYCGEEYFDRLWDADQMRDYARAAVLAEREACAKACDELVSGTYKIPGLYPEAVFGKRCAAAIRARSTP